MFSVVLRGVSKRYPNGEVGLRETDLVVEPGERLALLGPSGSGKSTLLRLIAGLERPDRGEIDIGGVRVDRVPPHRRQIAFLPQRATWYPNLTVQKHLELARPGRRMDPGPAQSGVKSLELPEISKLLRMESLLNRYPQELSGGERQRVALAKLLARGSRIWLLDEPFSGLDPVFRSEFRHDLHLLLDTLKATIILVTHDPIDALALGRRVGVLGEGWLQQIGSAEQLRDHPGNRFVAFCLGQMSLIEGHVGGGDPSRKIFTAEGGLVHMELPPSIARRFSQESTPNLTLGIRPEDVLVRSPGDTTNLTGCGAILTGWPAILAEPVGSGWLLTLTSGRTRIRASWPSGSPPPVGASRNWFLPADRCLWFDGSGRRIVDENGPCS